MKTFENQAAQGDLLITRVDDIPSDAIEQRASDGQFIVAHSETGHHHVVAAESVRYFHAANQPDFEGQVAFLHVDAPADLRHLKGFDRHETIRINPGEYRIVRSRERFPEGWRRALD